MPLFKKKLNNDEPFSPEQLKKLEDKGDLAVDRARNWTIFERFSARRDSKDISRAVRWKRRAGITLVVSVLVLLILWIIGWLLTTIGDLVISVESGAAKEGIIISESLNEDGSAKDPALQLSAQNVTEVTNITYDWLPTDLDTEGDGEHNGENYLAYTFYLTNGGSETLDYQSTLRFTGIAKNADEALRVMIYKNGEPTIYAQKNRDDSQLEDIVNFEFVEGADDLNLEDYVIMNDKTEGIAPNETVKYTIVTWIEGNDPECINDIMGGYVKMQWFFNVDGEEL
ncbi:MAG: hypothetical protein E7513_01740 [Ruminococcaceae bacterium]|nr:hypothetical protein [Oscillospiraceae bacterium]